MARLLNLWWIPFAVALAAVIARETNWGEGLYNPPVIAPVPDAKPFAPTLLPEYKPTAAPEAYAEVIDRPLFSPTRRQAPPPPPPEPPKQVMQTGQYQLTGTIQVGDKVYAFLRETRNGKGIRAAQGDILSGGIKLAKVEAESVLFTQYEDQEEVKLLVSKSNRMTPAAAQPPGAPSSQPITLRPNAVPSPPPGTAQLPGQPFIPGTTISAPIVPTESMLTPFVPGVSGVAPPRNDGRNDDPPRRRGAMQ